MAILISVDGSFSPWSQWSHCTVTCGTSAVSRRERRCNNPKPGTGGRDCVGEWVQFKSCGRKPCSGETIIGNFKSEKKDIHMTCYLTLKLAPN